MNKVYLIVPLAGVALFGAAYGNHKRDYDARLADYHRSVEAAHQEKLKADAALRAQAHATALATRDQRAREREAQALRDAAEKSAREAEERRRDLALHEETKAQQQLGRLKADLERLQAGLARSEAETRGLESEQAFLLAWIEKTQANRHDLMQLLAQLDEVERARAALVAEKPPR